MIMELLDVWCECLWLKYCLFKSHPTGCQFEMFPHYSSSGIVIANVDDIKFIISSLASGGNVDSAPSAETYATPAPAPCKSICGKTAWQHSKLHVLLSLWLYLESEWVCQSKCCHHEPEWSLIITEERPAKTQIREMHIISMNFWTTRIENNRTKWCLLRVLNKKKVLRHTVPW